MIKIILERITGTFEFEGKVINYEYYIKTGTMIFGLGSEKLSDEQRNRIFKAAQHATIDVPQEFHAYD